VATAWSGYQAAQWAGKCAEEYAKANRLRVTAEGLATLAGQERIYDSDTLIAGSPPSSMAKPKWRSSSSGVFATSIDLHSQLG
jgi:hypothetical protein